MTPLRWTRTPPTEAGWVLVRNSTVLRNMVPTDVRVEPDGLMVANGGGVWTAWGGPNNYGIYWGDTEFAPIPPPEEPRSGDPEAAEEEGS